MSTNAPRITIDTIAPHAVKVTVEHQAFGVYEYHQHDLEGARADLMDGGVTAALIEKEAEPTDVWRRRAEKAERERDARDAAAHLWKETARKLARESRNAHDWAARVEESIGDVAARAEQPRPLDPREHLAALWETAHRPVGGRIPAGTAIITRSDYGSGDVRYQTLEATGRDLPDPGYTLERNYPYGPEGGEEYRLLDPPARPEGAEELNELIGEYLDSTPGVDDKGMADHLAARGVRVVTEDGAA